jgi:hypothetical protein
MSKAYCRRKSAGQGSHSFLGDLRSPLRAEATAILKSAVRFREAGRNGYGAVKPILDSFCRARTGLI